jgi:hypothetical protein
MYTLIRCCCILFLASCGMRTVVLQDGITKVPAHEKQYAARTAIPPSLTAQMDTTVIYEAFNTTVYTGDRPVSVLARLNTSHPDTWYAAYRFYSNGRFNLFILNREADTAMTAQDFNPARTGYRGIYYSRRNGLQGDLVVPVSGMGYFGTRTDKLEFRQDTLLVYSSSSEKPLIFLKRKLPAGYLKWTGTWGL